MINIKKILWNRRVRRVIKKQIAQQIQQAAIRLRVSPYLLRQILKLKPEAQEVLFHELAFRAFYRRIQSSGKTNENKNRLSENLHESYNNYCSSAQQRNAEAGGDRPIQNHKGS